MGVAPGVFARLESAAENRMYPKGIKIVRRYNAPCRDLGPVADAESRAHDLAHKKCVKQRAVSLQVSKIWPRNSSMARLAARRSGEGKQLLLVGYRRVRAKEDPFDPAENSGVGANAQSQAKDRQDGKTRGAAEHAEAEA